MSGDAKQRAEDLHDRALALEGDDDDEALRLYHDALLSDPLRPTTLYNIGLIHKYRGEWAESLDFNRRAVTLDPSDEAANWNLAIAATALGDWRTARSVWHRLGYGIDEGDTVIDDDFGLTPVRLNPQGEAEVVWAQRICPVRARIVSIPLPGSGFRRDDVVLHDGAGTGSRLHDGREKPVFNVFMTVVPSRHATYELRVDAASPADIEALETLLEAQGCAGEDWTANLQILCKACSEGVPHEHDESPEGRGHEWQRERLIGVSAPSEAMLKSVLADWTNPERVVRHLALALDAPAWH